ncbi:MULTISPECIES: cytochrome P450 [Prauserella salsuginis group]|uniref:Cytochrome P450 n=1 Tax=Prauserella salsuginis TaxID=387889 RepID=A0ABW6G0U9_9PSEU|nr:MULTISPECIES: cytochrome P450 [Prauserella salsuginis group]MCR3721972.1 Cytochrome P450 [Prauserella flava]MCR3735978.1 Cytochrome P450 [Prauserella salsuginis]
MTTTADFDPFAPDAGHEGGAVDGRALVSGPYGFAALGHELASTVLRDPRFQNSALRLMEEFGITEGPVHDFRARSIIMIEGDPHMRLRTPLARFMSPVTVERIRGVLRAIVETITDDLDDSKPFDFYRQVAYRIPSMVYCHLAGAPFSDAPKVQSLSERTLALLHRDRSLAPSIRAAYDELFDYLDDLIRRKREQGFGEDMLSYLLKQGDDGKLTEQEVLTEATSMLEASSVNTAHQAGLVVWTLLRDRDVWRRLVADPELIPAAVVEALRLYPRTGLVSKIATEDVELGDVVIPRGSDVHVAVWSANRDPERFENPGAFSLDRECNQPLTFSTGPHNCLGQGLAKAEIEEVVRHLAEHYPDAVVDEDATRIGQAGGRWLVESLTVDLRP